MVNHKAIQNNIRHFGEQIRHNCMVIWFYGFMVLSDILGKKSDILGKKSDILGKRLFFNIPLTR
jgi:hypothetical protein